MSAEGFVFSQHFIRREIPLIAGHSFIAAKQEKMLPVCCKMLSFVWSVQISGMLKCEM